MTGYWSGEVTDTDVTGVYGFHGEELALWGDYAS